MRFLPFFYPLQTKSAKTRHQNIINPVYEKKDVLMIKKVKNQNYYK